MIIAIDGPAASGKGTLGKRLAAHYGLRHLDTGLLYRAVAKALLDAGHSPNNQARAVAAADAIDPAAFDEDGVESPRGRRSRIAGVGHSRRARRAAGVPAQLRDQAARRGARRTRHRHGDLSARRGEIVRHRDAAGAGATPRSGNSGQGRKGRRSRDPRRHPAARRARHVTRRPRRSSRRPTRICSTPRRWMRMPCFRPRSKWSSACGASSAARWPRPAEHQLCKRPAERRARSVRRTPHR